MICCARDCSPGLRPVRWRANPAAETTDWRAVCGRTACTVRRAGRAQALPDPYRTLRGVLTQQGAVIKPAVIKRTKRSTVKMHKRELPPERGRWSDRVVVRNFVRRMARTSGKEGMSKVRV